jgi:ketosteroid isomerase-like protein
MSTENIEIVRRAIAAAFARPPDLDTARELSDPAVVLTTNWGVEATEHHGIQGLLDGIEEMAAAFDPWRQDVERVTDAGPDSVVALMRLTARGKESGVPVEFQWAMVFLLRGERIASVRSFIDQGEALKAVGLEEQSP